MSTQQATHDQAIGHFLSDQAASLPLGTRSGVEGLYERADLQRLLRDDI